MELTKKKAIAIMLIVDICGVIASFFIVSLYDIISIDLLSWVRQMFDMGYLDMYKNVDVIATNPDYYINYPPIYPSYLYLIHILFEPVTELETALDVLILIQRPVVQFLMKSFSIIGFVVIQCVLYRFVSIKSAVLWSINYPFLLMSFVWGQRDAIFCFLIMMLLYTMEKGRLYVPSLIFAFMCLLKPQGAYLIVILALYLVTAPFKVKEKLLSLLSGGLVGLLSFLPFMIHQKDLLLPIKLYAGVGATGGAKFGCQACNIYWVFNHVHVPNYLRLVAILLFFIATVTSILHYRKTKDLSYTCFFYLFSIFMYNIGQHERYVLYAYGVLFYICFIKGIDVSKHLKLAFSISSIFYSVFLTIILFVTNKSMLYELKGYAAPIWDYSGMYLFTGVTFIANVGVAVLYRKHIRSLNLKLRSLE